MIILRGDEIGSGLFGNKIVVYRDRNLVVENIRHGDPLIVTVQLITSGLKLHDVEADEEFLMAQELTNFVAALDKRVVVPDHVHDLLLPHDIIDTHALRYLNKRELVERVPDVFSFAPFDVGAVSKPDHKEVKESRT